MYNLKGGKFSIVYHKEIQSTGMTTTTFLTDLRSKMDGHHGRNNGRIKPSELQLPR